MDKTKLKNEQLLVDESLLFVGNGYIGLRGNLEEGYPDAYQTIRGTYINGFYEDVFINYGESAYGFPKSAQKMLNLIDGQTISIRIDGDEFSLFDGEIVSLERRLDIWQGFNLRRVDWISPKGHHLLVEIRKMTSFEQLELAIIEYRVHSVNYTGDLSILSTLNGDVYNYADANDPRVSAEQAQWLYVDSCDVTKENYGQITSATKRSGLKVTATMAHDIDLEYEIHGNTIVAFKHDTIEQGETRRFSKYLVYVDNVRSKDPQLDGLKIMTSAIQYPSVHWFDQQRQHLEKFWTVAKIDIEGDASVEEALNYSVYQLYASAGRDVFSNISAKGLSGEGYEGHYFWDTEIYMLPFFILTHPKIAKNLLAFRYQILDSARVRALTMGHSKGAKIPWRTISGTECSAYFPAGSAQYHINADVAYAYIQYYLYSKDIDFIKAIAYETLVETGRIWLEIGHFDEYGQFRIPAVTGPDEYSALVNNNYYTNVMAQYHMKWICRLTQELKENDRVWFSKITQELNLEMSEIINMEKAYQNMYFPYSKELGIYWQDDSYKDKKDWDFENTPKHNYPLLLHYHPLTIYRYRVLKQADTLLAYFLLDHVPEEIMKKSYQYYEPLTTHDSSLSPCVHSIMAARLQDVEKAYSYFMKTIRLDLDNLHHNTKDGLHIANAGGAYMSIVYGFAGLRIKEDGLHFNPIKPSEWKMVRFRIYYQGALVTVTLSDEFCIETTDTIKIIVNQIEYEIDEEIRLDYKIMLE